MAPSSPQSRRRRANTALLVVGATAALAALAAPASAARVLAGSGTGTGGAWGGGGGGQLAKAVRREEERLQRQFQQQHLSSWTSPTKLQGGTLPPAKCLFIFDLDRTLTGIQGSGKTPSGDGTCPADKTTSITDSAYKGGKLTLSDLALNMASTYAGQNCYLGIISHGSATSLAEHVEVGKLLSSEAGNAKMPKAADLKWADASQSNPAPAPFVINAPDETTKFKYVPLIQKFYKDNGVAIKDEDVYFNDDKPGNIKKWAQTNYNAMQVSCRSRDPSNTDLGNCGATVAEFAKHKTGCNLCSGPCK